MKITFGDVQRKYSTVSKCIDYVFQKVEELDSNPLVMRLDGTKVDRKTLSRWLLNSAGEFFNDYQKTVLEIDEKTYEQEEQIEDWQKELALKLDYFIRLDIIENPVLIRVEALAK